MEMIKCKCCNKKIEDMFNRKYCGSCSRFTFHLRQRLSYYKRQFKVVNKKLYGTENGAERIRDSHKKRGTHDK